MYLPKLLKIIDSVLAAVRAQQAHRRERKQTIETKKRIEDIKHQIDQFYKYHEDRASRITRKRVIDVEGV